MVGRYHHALPNEEGGWHDRGIHNYSCQFFIYQQEIRRNPRDLKLSHSISLFLHPPFFSRRIAPLLFLCLYLLSISLERSLSLVSILFTILFISLPRNPFAFSISPSRLLSHSLFPYVLPFLFLSLFRSLYLFIYSFTVFPFFYFFSLFSFFIFFFFQFAILAVITFFYFFSVTLTYRRSHICTATNAHTSLPFRHTHKSTHIHILLFFHLFLLYFYLRCSLTFLHSISYILVTILFFSFHSFFFHPINVFFSLLPPFSILTFSSPFHSLSFLLPRLSLSFFPSFSAFCCFPLFLSLLSFILFL